MKNLHLKIREARTRSRFPTQKALAEVLGVTPAAISQWESLDPDKRTTPTMPTLMRLAELTEHQINWFLEAGFGGHKYQHILTRPLTDEEINILDKLPSYPSDAEIMAFARAIERAHGIGVEE